VRLLSAADAIRLVASELRIVDPSGLLAQEDQIIAEYIRKTIVDIATREGELDTPVYISKVLNGVRAQLSTLIPSLQRKRNQRPSQRLIEAEGDTHPDAIRRILDALSDIGDLAHLGNGYWVPTPVRFVHLSEEIVLIAGGVPTFSLREFIGAPVHLSWIGRTVLWQALPNEARDNEALWQSKSSWLGKPPDDLNTWTGNLLASASRRMAPSASGLEEFEIYLPGSRPTQPQAFRWISSREIRREPEGLRLCRATEGRWFSVRRYFLAKLTRIHAGWVVSQECAVDQTDVRRLQYGFDAREQTPVLVRQQTRKGAAVLTFADFLPAEERRVLIAFGRDESRVPGRLPTRVAIETSHLPIVLEQLSRLGIAVRPTERGATVS
jgi:hypothetical protein